jgi:hypothetical protein
MQSIGHDRREFIAKSFSLAGAASLASFGVRNAAAQAPSVVAVLPTTRDINEPII